MFNGLTLSIFFKREECSAHPFKRFPTKIHPCSDFMFATYSIPNLSVLHNVFSLHSERGNHSQAAVGDILNVWGWGGGSLVSNLNKEWKRLRSLGCVLLSPSKRKHPTEITFG